MIDCICAVHVNSIERSDLVRFVTKSKQGNDMTDCKNAVYVEKNIKQLGHIKRGAIFDCITNL